MKLKNYLKNNKFYVWKETFAIIKSKKPLSNAFAIIKDKNETTVVIDQSRIKENNKNIIKIDRNWRIITFDAVLPLNLIGFLAGISKTLADEGISVFVISTFSTDHILIKNKNLKKAVIKLKGLGLKIQ